MTPIASLTVVALLAAACGGSGGSTGPGGAASGQPASAATSGTSAGASASTEPRGDLTVVNTWAGAELDAFKEVMAGFSGKYPKVNVKLTELPFDSMNSQMVQQFAAGTPPDVLDTLPGLIHILAAQDQLLPIDDLWQSWLADGSYNRSLEASASYKDHAYGAWFKGNVNCLVWSMSSTDQRLGLTAAPQTWSDFTAALDKARAAGMDPLAVGGKDVWVLHQTEYCFMARIAGADKWNGLIDGTVKWDDPAVVASVQAFSDFMAKYFPADALDIGFSDEVCRMVDGKAAFENNGAFVNLTAQSCKDGLTPGTDYNFFLMPKYDDSKPMVQFVSGDLFSIAKATKNPVAAKALVSYLASPEAQEIWAKKGGFIAPNAHVSADVYPTAPDKAAAALWPHGPNDLAAYDLDDSFGGQIETTDREAQQQLFKDHDVNKYIQTMLQVTQQVRGGS